MTATRLDNAPFAPSSGPPRVFVSGGAGPAVNTREALSHFDLTAARGKRVLLKPNVGRMAHPDSGIVTNPGVVAAAIDVFREHGAEVVVGESPITGVDVMEAFEASGIAAVCRERDCPMLDLDEPRAVKVELPEGVAIHSLMVCREVLAADLVVSMPVMKTHMHTGVTLAVKNMKGCLWRRSKVKLHMLPAVPDSDEKPIDVAIADLSWALCPAFAILDGTTGMEGLGPSAGSPKPVDTVVAGADAFAVDAVGCALMGLDAHDVPHLRIGADLGYGCIDLGAIDVGPADWRERVAPFEPPPQSFTVTYPNIQVLDENSCSACQSTLALLLKAYGPEVVESFPEGQAITIVIGKGNEEVPDGALCIGNCAMRHKGEVEGTYVPGCPPVGSEILSKLLGGEWADLEDGGGDR